MGYYMGDFYARGGRTRYMGDPGFFSFLGGLAKKAVGIGASFIPGVGPAISSAIEKVGAHVPPSVQSVVKKGAAIVSAHPVLSAAGAASVVGAGAAALHARGSMAGAGQGMARHARGGGGGGRHRRMNVCNPKALRRAIRRTHSFAKLAMKTIHLVHPKKHATFGGFRKRRKK